jgi:flagellar assembly protein FliH
MPVLKRQHAAPLVKDAIVLDMGDLMRQAERIKAAAEQQARAILADAKAEGARLAAEARQQAHEAGRVEGLQEGRAEGLEQGRTQAFAEAAERLSQLQQAWMNAAGQWDAERQAMHLDAKQAVIELAVRFAETLVHRAIAVDSNVVGDQVAAALSHVLRPGDVSIRICPDDRALLEQAMPDLAARFEHLKHVHLVDDAQIGRGGCVVTYGQGRIDATVKTQFRRIAELVLPSSAEASAPAADTPECADRGAVGTPIAGKDAVVGADAAPNGENKDEPTTGEPPAQE